MKIVFVRFRLPRKTDMERYALFLQNSFNYYSRVLSHPHQLVVRFFLPCRKIEIVQFASRTRQLFVRLLALVKWASNAGKVEKCAVRPEWKISVACSEHWLCIRGPSVKTIFFISISMTTDDLQLPGPADHPVCGHGGQAGISGPRRSGPRPAAQLRHPLCHWRPHHGLVPPPAHVHTGTFPSSPWSTFPSVACFPLSSSMSVARPCRIRSFLLIPSPSLKSRPRCPSWTRSCAIASSRQTCRPSWQTSQSVSKSSQEWLSSAQLFTLSFSSKVLIFNDFFFFYLLKTSLRFGHTCLFFVFTYFYATATHWRNEIYD